MIANTFYGIEDKGGFVKQADESLRPGGRFIIVNWHDQPKEATTIAGEACGSPEELRMSVKKTLEIMEETFEDIEEVDLPPYHYAVTGRR